jgi:hypothetical protein
MLCGALAPGGRVVCKSVHILIVSVLCAVVHSSA